MAVLTDAHNGNALARLRKVDLARFFDHIISFDMTGAKKPAPDAFLLALKKLLTLPPETLLVGDSLRRDIAPAQALCMITAYANTGTGMCGPAIPPPASRIMCSRPLRSWWSWWTNGSPSFDEILNTISTNQD